MLDHSKILIGVSAFVQAALLATEGYSAQYDPHDIPANLQAHDGRPLVGTLAYVDIEKISANGLVGVEHVMTKIKVFSQAQSESQQRVYDLNILGRSFNSDRAQDYHYPLKVLQTEYELAELAVFSVHGDWAEVEVLSPKLKFAWVRISETEKYRALQELLLGQMAYPTRENVRLYLNPNISSEVLGFIPQRASVDRVGHQITLLSSSLRGGDIWMLVSISNSVCDPSQPGKEIAKAWLPLYDQAERVNLWFYSRGC